MNQIITYRFNYPITQLNYFNKLENDFYKQCENFIAEFGKYFEENNEFENTIKRMNQFYIDEDSFVKDSIKNEDKETNLNDENNNENIETQINLNDEKNNSFTEDSIKNEDKNEIKNKFKGGNDELQTEIEDKKENFISLKMEISTNLLLRWLIVLMIFVIVMIIIFIIKIELKPIINYKIPQNYKYFSIQPPYHNVKKFSIYNQNKSIVSGLNEIKNNISNRGKEEIKKPITIEEKAEQIVKPVEEQVRLEPVVNVGGNPEGFTPNQFFSSSYSFGDM